MTDWTLVTGASEGIGKAIARHAAQRGRNVILVARSEDKLNVLASELAETGVKTLVLPADLSRMEEVERIWSEAADAGRIENLVNNAGLGRNGRFAEGGWDRELATLRVNIDALTRLMKLAIPHMLDHGVGRILNVASVAAFMPGPGMAVYHASKSYVLSLSEAVAEELRGTRVSVTALCPGPTRSNFFADAQMEDVNLVRMGNHPTSAQVAEQGWHAMIAERRIVVTGTSNKILSFLPRLVPRGIVTPIAKKVLSRRH